VFSYRDLGGVDIALVMTRPLPTQDASDWPCPTVSEWRAWLAEQPTHDRSGNPVPGTVLADKTRRNIEALVSQIFNFALRYDPLPLLGRNPCTPLGLTVPEAVECVWLERSAAELLLACLDPHFVVLVQFLLGTGVRWGEAAALQVEDLRLDEPQPWLFVHKTWKRLGRRDASALGRAKHVWGRGRTKTATGRAADQPDPGDGRPAAPAGGGSRPRSPGVHHEGRRGAAQRELHYPLPAAGAGPSPGTARRAAGGRRPVPAGRPAGRDPGGPAARVPAQPRRLAAQLGAQRTRGAAPARARRPAAGIAPPAGLRTVPGMTQEPEYTIAEAARILGWGPTTLRDACSRREVPHHRRHRVKGIFFTDTDIAEIKAARGRRAIVPAAPPTGRRTGGESSPQLDTALARLGSPLRARRLPAGEPGGNTASAAR
jgi:hypothetical protein